MKLGFYKLDNSLGYNRNTFDDFYDKPNEIEKMLQPLLNNDEAAIVNLEDTESVDYFAEEYNDEIYDLGWLCVVIHDEEPAKEKPWEFNEEDFISQYCPIEGGNDYLGWIDDIHKLLDGEAEPGDAASTGEYAKLSEDELRKELERLKGIVLRQAFDRYMEENY